MLRIVVTICAVSQLATALPQRQLGGGGAPQQPSGPRPVSSPGAVAQPAASTLGVFNQALNQQLAYGQAAQQAAANQQQLRGRIQSPYTQAINQPIIISQAGQTASPATPSFAAFGAANPFGGAGRQILTLRSPGQQADEDEYEYEDDDEPTIQSRPSPRPSSQSRTPVRASQTPASALGAGRFSVQQQQPQQQRQRQPSQSLQSHLGNYASQPLQPVRSAPRPDNSQFGIDGKRSRLTTPPPVQTVNRFMKQNDDGSVTWGYENEDGTFKEETLGADCVVRGKYGYVDPEGNKREYEYQTGNPCDPNKKDQEEEELEENLEDGPSRPQQLAGVLNARPRPVQRRPGQQQQIPQQYQQQPQYALS